MNLNVVIVRLSTKSEYAHCSILQLYGFKAQQPNAKLTSNFSC